MIGGTGRTAILVTGMHRSGTSALTRIMSLLGAALPKELVEANAGNPTGHWEPQGMVDLNDRMLADAGSGLYSVVDIRPDWFSSPAAARFTSEASHLIERIFGDEDLIVLKDPRTSLLAPVWNRALTDCGYRVVHVLALRHPIEVAESLRRRHLRELPYDAWAEPRGEAVWLRYTLAAVYGSRGHARVFVHYAELLGDWRGEVDRIGRELGITWPCRDAAAEREIEGFLHKNDRVNAVPSALAAGLEQLGELRLVHLACAYFADLVKIGDDAERVNFIHSEFRSRIAGSRDLVLMLEGLYPLVWQFYERGHIAQGQLQAALSAEVDLRTRLRQHWSALVSANDERRRLQADVGSRDRQVANLHDELTKLESRFVSQAIIEWTALNHTTPDTEAALRGAENDRDEALRLLAAARDKITALNQEMMTVRTRLAATRDDVAMSKRDMAALHTSTSWRVTAPLRALSQVLRGRS